MQPIFSENDHRACSRQATSVPVFFSGPAPRAGPMNMVVAAEPGAPYQGARRLPGRHPMADPSRHPAGRRTARCTGCPRHLPTLTKLVDAARTLTARHVGWARAWRSWQAQTRFRSHHRRSCSRREPNQVSPISLTMAGCPPRLRVVAEVVHLGTVLLI